MNFNFKHYGTVDVSDIFKKLQKLDWDRYTFRQDTHAVHKETKTIPLLFDERLKGQKIHQNFGLFIRDLEQIKGVLQEKIGPGVMQSAILINLPAGRSVARHKDKGELFQACHRIHVPISTNELCFFEVDNEVKNLKSGEIWEIDNGDKHHSVRNEGATDRIHLLIDWKQTV